MACAVVSVPFVRSNRTRSGGATVVLRCPHHTQTIGMVIASFNPFLTDNWNAKVLL